MIMYTLLQHYLYKQEKIAQKRLEVFASNLEKEVALEKIIGPFEPGATWHINRVGVIPKGHTPGRWHMIMDLSYPPGASVNDGIEREPCSLTYITVDQVAAAASNLGRGALLAKVDVDSAYRLVPVHPDDRFLLAIVVEQSLCGYEVALWAMVGSDRSVTDGRFRFVDARTCDRSKNAGRIIEFSCLYKNVFGGRD